MNLKFDYPTKNTSGRLFYFRKYTTTLLAGLGLVFIIIALFATKQQNDPLPPLELITNTTNSASTLDLNNFTTATANKSKHPNSAIDVANTAADPSLDNTAVSAAQTKCAKAASAQAASKAQQAANWQTIIVTSGDTLAKIFSRLSLSEALLHKLVHSHAYGKQLANIHPNQELCFLFDDKRNLQALKIKLSPIKTLHIQRNNTEQSGYAGYDYSYDEHQVITKIFFKQNVITDSLYTSAKAAGLSDKLIMQLADIFSWDIDFSMGIRENDSFRILYEEAYVNNKKINSGNIIIAEFINQNQVYQAIRFTDQNGSTGYYSPEGYSMQKAFLRNPVKFTRISSRFSHGRHHPTLHRIRAHKGVDYAAPIGTPVEAAGDGKVVFKGNKGGYGLAVELQHGSKYSTLYAHLSKFAPKVCLGSYVKQGQVVGYVGKTGLATGPHLHYEFRIDGEHHDPLTVKLPKALSIEKKYQREFKTHATNMLKMLNKSNKEYLARR